MAQLLLHLVNITIYENTFITGFPGIPDLLFPFPGNPVTIHTEAQGEKSGRRIAVCTCHPESESKSNTGPRTTCSS